MFLCLAKENLTIMNGNGCEATRIYFVHAKDVDVSIDRSVSFIVPTNPWRALWRGIFDSMFFPCWSRRWEQKEEILIASTYWSAWMMMMIVNFNLASSRCNHAWIFNRKSSLSTRLFFELEECFLVSELADFLFLC